MKSRFIVRMKLNRLRSYDYVNYAYFYKQSLLLIEAQKTTLSKESEQLS